ncbi:GtrB-like O-antigen conversion [Baekduia alba]|uniref:trifunctional glycosyltransferase/class I SAM-dependent methyltransferase/polysaccharide deacetylase n=1 Tax=Baekduia alba TaxID=2997333 RepID=UPI0023418ED4|nr:trifunctional glycosyltransferase/class I SAM-dependent methyltransferase/polysaccharide deacetylase [Baekduia alba]WCB96940.1 GtrB-like O-antigen conversion [Baekduia alba]
MGLTTAEISLDVSVVIPAFNAAETLAETIASLQAQTFTAGAWEAVVVDDGSTDDTARVAQALAAADPRVRWIPKENAGVSATRNRGLREARNPWLLFLDADDLLVPEALAWFMDEVRRDPSLDLVYGGWCRLLPDGRLFDEVRDVPADDLFRSFSGTCAFAIHACVTRRDLVLAAGGFDESLRTCEDWDLWQRLARGGLRAVEVPRRIAIYRLRRQSASNDGVQMLRNGLEVIDRGHGEDPRVVEPVETHRAGADARMEPLAKLGMAAYCAGLVLGRGGDPEAVLTLVDDLKPMISDPAAIGWTISAAVPLGRAQLATDWPSFEPELWDRVDALLQRFETIAGVPLFARRARKSFDRAILAALDDTAGALRLGDAQLLDVDPTAGPPADVALEDGVQRLICRVRDGGELLDELELPVFGSTALGWHVADAIADRLGWTLLARHLERAVEPGLSARDDADARSWELFLQQLWGLPTVTTSDFYSAEAEVGEDGDAGGALAGTVEVSAPLPELPDGEVAVAVTCGGVPLGTVTVGAHEPRTPHALRSAIVWQCGFELCVAAVRAGLLASAGTTGTLRERVAAAAAAGAPSPPAALRVGITAAGTVAGPQARRAVLPAAFAGDVAELMGLDGRPVQRGDGELVVIDPTLLNPGSAPAQADVPGTAPEGSSPEEFDMLFARTDDPWSYDNAYERDKYDRTLALAPPHVATALELGCAAGHFTVRLAERADDLHALDVSPFALDHARRRVAAAGRDGGVRFDRHDLFADALPYAAAELVVCSEVLYYAGTVERLRFAIGQIAASVTPGGAFVTAHARLLVDDERGFAWGLPFGAASITRELADSFLRLEAEVVTDAYVVQRWVRPRDWIAAHRPRRVHRERAALPDTLPPAVAEMLRNDGEAAEITQREPADRVPVLAYHRISPTGSAFNAQWRTHPEQFEAHLAHLRAQGYYSVAAEELATAMRTRQPLRGRPIVISFDDAYADFPDHAWPLLRKYGFSATVFAVADCTGGHNAWDDHRGERLDLMGWATLRRLQDQGAEIGSHTAAHPPLSALPPREVATDLLRSRLAMGRALGRAPASLAYPFGDVDDAVARVAAACGFTIAFTCEPGTARFDGQPMTAPRLEVTGDDDVAALAAKLAEH